MGAEPEDDDPTFPEMLSHLISNLKAQELNGIWLDGESSQLLAEHGYVISADQVASPEDLEIEFDDFDTADWPIASPTETLRRIARTEAESESATQSSTLVNQSLSPVESWELMPPILINFSAAVNEEMKTYPDGSLQWWVEPYFLSRVTRSDHPFGLMSSFLATPPRFSDARKRQITAILFVDRLDPSCPLPKCLRGPVAPQEIELRPNYGELRDSGWSSTDAELEVMRPSRFVGGGHGAPPGEMGLEDQLVPIDQYHFVNPLPQCAANAISLMRTVDLIQFVKATSLL